MSDARLVLLIDDERAIATAISVRLRALGYRVNTAHDGRSGLEQALALTPDVILLDIRLPDMEGYEVCKALKLDPGLTSVPVIFVSANVQDQAKQAALDAGGIAFIPKPFEPKQLIDAIHAASPVAG